MQHLPSADLLARLAPMRPVPGCPRIVAHQADEVVALWQAWEQESGARQEVPFWATVWPAARVLAAWLLDNEATARGRCVLDLGCGGGVVAMAAALSSAARVVANDVDPVALHVARANAAANRVDLDLSSTDLLAGPAPAGFDLVLVADLFYEREQAERTLRLLGGLRSHGARAIVADAGRPFAPATGVRELERVRVAVNPDLEGTAAREVRILELR